MILKWKITLALISNFLNPWTLKCLILYKIYDSLLVFYFFPLIFFLLQEDFDEFDDVDELYSSLPLDKVETLEDLVTIPTSLPKVFVSSLLLSCKLA